MNVAVFDTHAFVKRLTAVGMPEAQAEVLAQEQMRLIDERLATKEDIARLQAASKEDIARLQAASKEDIARVQADIAKLQLVMEAFTKTNLAETKADILKWTFGMIGFQTVIMLGAVIALARLAH